MYTGLMNNRLFSRILNIMWVWVPKSMCSTVRTVWIDLHKILNPFIELEAPNMCIHKLHEMQRFQMKEGDKVSDVIVIIRDPIDRFISTFLDKHVRMRQWHYTDTHNYRIFRIFLDVHCLEHTIASFLMFIESHGHIDVHDLPQAVQIGRLPIRAHAIPLDDRALDRARRIVEPVIMNRPNLSSDTKTRACQRLAAHDRVNALPRHPMCTVLPVMTDMMSITAWREIVRKMGGFPPNTSVWEGMSDESRQLFQRIYHQDIHLYQQILLDGSLSM